MWIITYRIIHTFDCKQIVGDINFASGKTQDEAITNLVSDLIKDHKFDQIIHTVIDPNIFEPAFLDIINFDFVTSSNPKMCFDNHIMELPQFKIYIDDKKYQLEKEEKEKREAIDYLVKREEMKEYERIKAKYNL